MTVTTGYSVPVLLAEMARDPRRRASDGVAWLRAQVQLRNCSSIGPLPRVWGRVIVVNEGSLVIGGHVRLRATPWAVELAALAGGYLQIGDDTFINAGASISACRSVRIGNGCHIGPRVLIMDNDFHSPGLDQPAPESRPVAIEDGAWIGAAAIILKGVTVGSGATVGAGSVVTRNVPAHSVVAGVPARPVARAIARDDQR